MKLVSCLIIYLLSLSNAIGQGSLSIKKIPAVRAVSPVKADGDLSDPAWDSSLKVEDLTEQRPTFGRAEDPASRTTFMLMYDDNAIYIGGICREQRDSISTELVGRDLECRVRLHKRRGFRQYNLWIAQQNDD